MTPVPVYLLLFTAVLQVIGVALVHIPGRKKVKCGEFGFNCSGPSKVKLCADDETYGPTFLCPAESYCSESSSDVCQTSFSYIAPEKTGATLARCRRYERIADTSVPNCKGYILCIPKKNKFQAVKFKCTGNTVFNGFTRSCSSPIKYKCPVINTTTTPLNIADDVSLDRPNRGDFSTQNTVSRGSEHVGSRPIDCKNYKFTVQNDNSYSGRAAYFCPPRALPGEGFPRCTVFSNQFCITLHKEDDDDQFLLGTRRRPRIFNYS